MIVESILVVALLCTGHGRRTLLRNGFTSILQVQKQLNYRGSLNDKKMSIKYASYPNIISDVDQVESPPHAMGFRSELNETVSTGLLMSSETTTH